MVRWLRWHCPPDTGFEIRALAVWGRARYFSVTEAPHNTDFHTWMGKKHFCFFQTAETGNPTPNSGVKGSGANHYPKTLRIRLFLHSSNDDTVLNKETQQVLRWFWCHQWTLRQALCIQDCRWMWWGEMSWPFLLCWYSTYSAMKEVLSYPI